MNSHIKTFYTVKFWSLTEWSFTLCSRCANTQSSNDIVGSLNAKKVYQTNSSDRYWKLVLPHAETQSSTQITSAREHTLVRHNGVKRYTLSLKTRWRHQLIKHNKTVPPTAGILKQHQQNIFDLPGWFCRKHFLLSSYGNFKWSLKIQSKETYFSLAALHTHTYLHSLRVKLGWLVGCSVYWGPNCQVDRSEDPPSRLQATVSVRSQHPCLHPGFFPD